MSGRDDQDDSEPPRLGRVEHAQGYSEKDLRRIAKDARPHVVGPKDAGKVYCPFCRFREARWRRHVEDDDPGHVRLFVYCTQCHKTGVTEIDLTRPARRGCLGTFALLLAAGALGGSAVALLSR